MKTIFSKLLIASLIFFTASCKKSTTDVVPTPTPPVVVTPLTEQTTNDVAYGTDALQKFNMVLPANRTTTSTKVLIIIHGGSWIGGDKNDMTQVVNAFKAQLPTYAFFNLNYRLGNPNTGANAFPTQVNDVKAAIDFIYSKRAEYNISDKIALLGASAGAHLALLQAYKNASPKIKAVVDLFGPTDLADMYYNPASPQVPAYNIAYITTGNILATPTTPSSSPALFAASSPMTFVSNQSCPTILFHGDADLIVRYQQSAMLSAKLTQNNVVNQYVLYPGQGHGYGSPSLDDTFVKSIAFLNTHVQ